MISRRAVPYVAASLLRYSISNGDQGIIRGDLENLTRIAVEASGLPLSDEIAMAALNLLVEGNLATFSEDDFAGTFFRISGHQLRYIVDRAEIQERDFNRQVERHSEDPENLLATVDFSDLAYLTENTVLRKFHEFGGEWLDKALEKLPGLEVGESVKFPSDQELRMLGNRVVALDQSDPKIAVASSTIDELSESLSTDNEVGSALGDDRSAAQAELAAAKLLLSADRVRVKTLLRLLSSTLRWLAERAAGSVVGEASKSLWKLIQEILF